MKPFTIILPTYCPDSEVYHHLNKCIANLFNNTSRDLYELIIVEQGFRHCAYVLSDLYIHAERPLGYARAVNIGLKLATTKYVCILNNDLFVPPGWLEQMMADFESDPNMGVLAPMDGPSEPGLHYDQHWWSCVLLRRDRFRYCHNGLLDEDKLNYRFHDQDANIIMRANGFHIARTGNVRVEHINSATYNKMKVDEGPEREEMMRRHGCLEFEEWIRKVNDAHRFSQ